MKPNLYRRLPGKFGRGLIGGGAGIFGGTVGGFGQCCSANSATVLANSSADRAAGATFCAACCAAAPIFPLCLDNQSSAFDADSPIFDSGNFISPKWNGESDFIKSGAEPPGPMGSFRRLAMASSV